MKVLIDLADEHVVISDMLKQVVNWGIVTDEARVALRAVKSLMFSHLKKENDHFYPVLRQAASTDKELEKLLKASGREIEAIYDMVLQFYDKYSLGGNNKEFARDLEMLYAAVRERITREERTLFKVYEKKMKGPRLG